MQIQHTERKHLCIEFNKTGIMRSTNFSQMHTNELNKVWQLFDIIRDDINSEEGSVVLLMLYLRSKNLIDPEFLNKSRNDRSEIFQYSLNEIDSQFDSGNSEFIDFYLNDRKEILNEILWIFNPVVNRLNVNTFCHLIHTLFEVDLNWLNENITVVFDLALEQISKFQGKRGGLFVHPSSLTSLINGCIGDTNGLKIFNPFAGAASFIIDTNNSEFTYAQELNQKTWAIGQLRLLVYESKAHLKLEDSFINWPHNEKFDLIVSSPPLGMRLKNVGNPFVSESKTSEPFFLEVGVNSLSQNGKLVAVLSNGSLFRGGSEQKLRKQLIEDDLIDTIISLPGGLLQNTGIPLVIMIIDKNKKAPGHVRFVDGQNFVDSLNSREKILDNEGLLMLIQSGYQDSDSVRIVDNRRIKDFEYNLSVPRYFQRQIEGTKLRDILTVVRGSKNTSPEDIKFVRIRDLQEDKINYTLDVSSLQDSTPNRPQLRIIEESCLLVAARWNTLKPTYFEYTGTPICVSNDILSFEIKEDLADTAYLINELHLEYVEEQLSSFRQVVQMPVIKLNDVLQVVIKLPSIEEQRAKVSGLREISEKIQQLQTERNALAHGVKLKEFNEFASLKHTLGRPRQNILGWSKNLSNFFDRKSISNTSLNQDFKELFDMGIMEAIHEINRDIKFISDVLEKGENGLVLEDYQKEIIPLDEVNQIFKNLSHNGFKFSIKKELLAEEDMKTRGVLINKVLMQTLLDNLLTNADKYGFKEKDYGNRVSIELSDIDNNLIIEVKNNGLPFPKNFNREKFILKYSTADAAFGSGLGGYDINRIATYFENENWELDLNSDPLYPVIFRFSLPIKLLK